MVPRGKVGGVGTGVKVPKLSKELRGAVMADSEALGAGEQGER